MNKLFLSCFKATELIEKKHSFKLTGGEKLKLRLHKLICDACVKYEKQSILIEKSISNMQKREPVSTDFKKLKVRISQNLERLSK